MNNIKIRYLKIWRLIFATWITTRQKRNVFATNLSTDIKLIKVQISKIIQSGESFDSWLANLGKKH